jgi:hypothetical protein
VYSSHLTVRSLLIRSCRASRRAFTESHHGAYPRRDVR